MLPGPVGGTRSSTGRTVVVMWQAAPVLLACEPLLEELRPESRVARVHVYIQRRDGSTWLARLFSLLCLVVHCGWTALRDHYLRPRHDPLFLRKMALKR